MLNKWCEKIWLYVMYTIGIILLVMLIVNWNNWSFGLRMICTLGIILPIHVCEEWQFPGGFHFQYNTLMKSETPNCYPMNQLTDMITNFCGELFFVCLLIGKFDSTGTILALTIFCWIEAIIHTLASIPLWKKFRDSGKKTIYGPGSASAHLLFAPAGVLGFVYLMRQQIAGSDVICAIIILAIMLIGMIVLPETLLKQKNSKYAFKNVGYFEKFLH